MRKPTRVERKRRRRRTFFRLVLLMAIIVLSIAYAFKTNFFNIDLINVEGNNKLEADQIIKASRINLGENILRIKTSEARDNVQSLSYIKKVSVKRKLPRIININIEERKPLLQIKAISSYMLLDEEGYNLELRDTRVENLPYIIGFDINGLSPGKNLLEDENGEKLKDFFNDISIKQILDKMEMISYESENNINITLNNGISVAFGPLDNVKYKLKVLSEILDDIEEKQIPSKMIIMNKGEHPILVRDDK